MHAGSLLSWRFVGVTRPLPPLLVGLHTMLGVNVSIPKTYADQAAPVRGCCGGGPARLPLTLTFAPLHRRTMYLVLVVEQSASQPALTSDQPKQRLGESESWRGCEFSPPPQVSALPPHIAVRHLLGMCRVVDEERPVVRA